MKSQLFKTAWELFKKYNMSFSQALVEAWKSVKREAIRIEVLKMDVSEWSQEIEFKNRIKNLKPVFYKLRQVINGTVDNSGARFDYGNGVYNGD